MDDSGKDSLELGHATYIVYYIDIENNYRVSQNFEYTTACQESDHQSRSQTMCYDLSQTPPN